MDDQAVTEPFPIFRVGTRYMLYDVQTITHVRRAHHICGTFIGTIPQISQQNVFLGIPAQLMPEEARRLCETGHAFIVDDVKAHKEGLLLGGVSAEEKKEFKKILDRQSRHAQSHAAEKSRKSRDGAFAKNPNHAKAKAEAEQKRLERENAERAGPILPESDAVPEPEEAVGLFSETASVTTSTILEKQEKYLFLTPATSHPPLPTPPPESADLLPEVPVSYPLFAFLHSKGYFMLPGLRFGCHYNVYPGDPLRFHSHFSAIGKQWDEEFDMMQIIGGGRLGTAVKKSFLLGGVDPNAKAQKGEDNGDEEVLDVRAFCVEWAGM